LFTEGVDNLEITLLSGIDEEEPTAPLLKDAQVGQRTGRRDEVTDESLPTVSPHLQRDCLKACNLWELRVYHSGRTRRWVAFASRDRKQDGAQAHGESHHFVHPIRKCNASYTLPLRFEIAEGQGSPIRQHDDSVDDRKRCHDHVRVIVATDDEHLAGGYRGHADPLCS
jgi:hypothetical protein